MKIFRKEIHISLRFRLGNLLAQLGYYLYPPKRPIHFLYSEKYSDSGSTVMRGKQLSKIASQYLKNRHVSYLRFSTDISDSCLFLTKGVIQSTSKQELETLRDANNVLIFDPVDGSIPDGYLQPGDILVAASRTAYKSYKSNLPHVRVQLINHHVDPRITQISKRSPKPKESLRVGYFGEIKNAYLTTEIKKIVTPIHVRTDVQNTDWIQDLQAYDIHYNIRTHQPFDSFKPFLKGFTAARCSAPILVQKDEESISWLGEDYPYFFMGNVTEEEIVGALNHLLDSYMSEDWLKSLRILQGVAKATSPESIGLELKRFFRTV